MKKFLPFILALFLSILSGCEGVSCGMGRVYDSSTLLPLDSVLCVSNGNEQLQTDSTGSFDLCGPFGGCTFGGCPDVEIEFSRAGYQSQYLTEKFDSVLLVKVR
jgi:hypothetical protein